VIRWICVLLAFWVATSQAQECRQAPRMHALDFWIGRWDVSQGGQLVGTNTIESTLDGCAILEHWRDVEGGEGTSLFYFNPNEDLWKQVWITSQSLKLGGTTLELHYLGLNHSDSTLVMRLPKEKIIFVVDTIPVGSMPGRGFIDIYPLETEDFIKKVLAMDWERMIPGHPGPGGRLGTKEDAQNLLTLMQEASAEIKKQAQDGKCWDAVEKEFKLPKYANWPGYENGLPFIARRYCGLWGRGT